MDTTRKGVDYSSSELRKEFPTRFSSYALAKTNAARASHPSRIVRGSLNSAILAARSNEMMITGPTGSRGVPLLPAPGARRGSENHALQPPQWASSPTRSKSAKWRRPQCPDKRKRSRATECPLAIHPRELPAATSVTAIIGRLESSHVFAGSHCGAECCGAQQKRAWVV